MEEKLQELNWLAQQAAQQGNIADALAAQERAVALAREETQAEPAGVDPAALARLSVLLYNLADYYQQAGRHDDAVAALEEVVILDERTGHPDLEHDQLALEQARQLAAMTPEEQAEVDRLQAQLWSQLENLSAEERAEVEAAVEELMPAYNQPGEAEEAALYEPSLQESMVLQAQQVAAAARRGELSAEEQATIAGQIDASAGQLLAGETLGPGRHDLAAFLHAVAAFLRDEELPAVPDAYEAAWAEIVTGKG